MIHVAQIRILDNQVINQIAAGEVIERPVNVVKEVVENAIDAKATRIDVEIVAGGLELIRVSDNGIGMSEADVRCCIERHATSKLCNEADLWALRTLGFRGEALAALSGVSDLGVSSRSKHDAVGYKVVVKAGRIVDEGPAGRAVGTTVEARNLFHNVPARKKFLKSPQTEAQRIGEQILHLALACPHVHFRFTKDGKIARDYPGEVDFRTRAMSLWQHPAVVYVEHTGEHVSFEAVVRRHQFQRSGHQGMLTLVNGRVVTDRSLVRAMAFGFGERLVGSQMPMGALRLFVPPDMLDVNVHPQKREVRFVNPRDIFESLTRATALAFKQAELLEHQSLNQASATPMTDVAEPTRRVFFERTLVARQSDLANEEPRHRVSVVSPYPHPHTAQATAYRRESTPKPRATGAPALRLIGHIRGAHVLCESAEFVYVFDLVLLRKQMMTRELTRRYNERTLSMRPLLFPERAHVDIDTICFIDEQALELHNLGVELGRLGPNTIALHAIPDLPADVSGKDVLQRLLEVFTNLAHQKTGGDEVASRSNDTFSTGVIECIAELYASRALAPIDPDAIQHLVSGIDVSTLNQWPSYLMQRIAIDELTRSRIERMTHADQPMRNAQPAAGKA